MISPVCFSGYYIMSTDYLETSHPRESAKGLQLLDHDILPLRTVNSSSASW